LFNSAMHLRCSIDLGLVPSFLEPREDRTTAGTVRAFVGATSTTASAPSIIIRIEPSRGWFPLNLAELWEYRELLYFLVWRDVKVRYKQTLLGVAWVAVQPVFTAVLFALLLGRVANLPSEGVPYVVFVFAALLPWQLFATALSRAGTSLVGSANLLTKVYFPRLVVPLAAVLGGLVDFLVSLAVIAALLFRYRLTPSWGIVLLPVFALMALLAALSVGIWLAALNVRYRDVQQAIPFLVQVWMFASPVVYSASVVPAGPLRFVYALNPLTGVIQCFRWALLGTAPPDGLMWVSFVAVAVLLLSGLIFFRRLEDTFADVV